MLRRTWAFVIPVSSQLTCACVWIRAAVADAQEKSAGEAMAKVKVILQKVYASLGEEFVDGEEFDGAVVREPTPSSAHVGSYRLAGCCSLVIVHAPKSRQDCGFV